MMIVPTLEGEHAVGIVRAHLEEDAAKTLHVGGHTGRIGGADYSLVDFNRGGTPLVEIVTAPDLHSAEEAKRFLQLLRQTIVELGISDAEMEKGTLRVDANVSVRPAGTDELRTRCEIKNMNSFNYIARGIEAEVERQIAVWESGGRGRAAHLRLRRGHGRAHAAAHEGGGGRLPLLPGARPRSARAVGRARRAAARRAARAAGGADPADRGGARPRSGGRARDRRARWAVGRRRSRRAPSGVAAANVIANTVVGAGVDRDRRAGHRACEARERPRPPSAPGLRRGDRQARGAGLLGRAVPRAGGRHGYLRAGADRGRDPGRQPRPGGGVPRWQGRSARLLRRPGDEGDEGPGESTRGQRPRAEKLGV